MRDGLTRAEAQAEAAERRLATHRATGRPALEPDAAAEAQAALEPQIGALGRIAERLHHSEPALAARKALDARVGTQCTQLERWAELDAVIGSSYGKELRTFAQGLTPESLLAEANVHLEQLRPRYRLGRLPGQDMDLMVVDRDLGEEPRSPSSLLGGETFSCRWRWPSPCHRYRRATFASSRCSSTQDSGPSTARRWRFALATLGQLQAEG